MKKIVTVGGGTGSYTVLSGLKDIQDISITAIVSMADDGGSTGVLCDELGVLPPGDVRQCLIALSEHDEIVRKLMGYRFSEGLLSGHSFGNIFLAALEKVSENFIEGVEVASHILKVKGKVIPVTNNKAELTVTLTDGVVLLGENLINHATIQQQGVASVAYKDKVHLNERAKEALLEADYIILGPGNYYCSLLPNLIVNGFKEAMQETKAKVIFPINLTNKQGHTMHWGVTEYVDIVETHIGRKVDHVLINNEPPSEDQVEFYKLQEGDGVLVIDDYTGNNAIRNSLLSHAVVSKQKGDVLHAIRSFIRHDSHKLATVIADIIFK